MSTQITTYGGQVYVGMEYGISGSDCQIKVVFLKGDEVTYEYRTDAEDHSGAVATTTHMDFRNQVLGVSAFPLVVADCGCKTPFYQRRKWVVGRRKDRICQQCWQDRIEEQIKTSQTIINLRAITAERKHNDAS
jgi:hypothetical protein